MLKNRGVVPGPVTFVCSFLCSSVLVPPVRQVSPARVQGLHPNIVRLQGSPIMARASVDREW